MLARLKGMGLKLCLVSNCSEEDVAGWEDCGLAPFFDEVVFSCAVAAAKPDPVIYRIALERVGAAPGQAVFVGDGGSLELEGAARVGLRPLHACWYNRTIASEYPKMHRPEDAAAAVERMRTGED